MYVLTGVPSLQGPQYAFVDILARVVENIIIMSKVSRDKMSYLELYWVSTYYVYTMCAFITHYHHGPEPISLYNYVYFLNGFASRCLSVPS